MLQTDMDSDWTVTSRHLALSLGLGHFLHGNGALRFVKSIWLSSGQNCYGFCWIHLGRYTDSLFHCRCHLIHAHLADAWIPQLHWGSLVLLTDSNRSQKLAWQLSQKQNVLRQLGQIDSTVKFTKSAKSNGSNQHAVWPSNRGFPSRYSHIQCSQKKRIRTRPKALACSRLARTAKQSAIRPK